jgi:hypothetical protein
VESSNQSKDPVFDISAIQTKVIDNINKPLSTLDDLERYFRTWFCKHYGFPYKCAEVDAYTLEELVWEYFDIYYRDNPDEKDKFLNRVETGELAEEEKWLKEQMGKDYISIEEQEKLLSKANVDKQIKDKKAEEMKIDFDLEEFK